MVTTMRGLNTFITDIRHCPNKESESRRCEKELAKIRNKFETQKGLSGYHRKKYVWKLLYMYILGYDIDFGHTESAFLINSPKFSEKYTGYVATGILVHENENDLYKTVANSIKTDLMSGNEINASLALATIGSLAPEELVIQLHKEIVRLALSEKKSCSLFVKKKALLCMLRIYRKYKDKFEIQDWIQPINQIFQLKYLSLGFYQAACAVVLGISQIQGYDTNNPFIESQEKFVKQLQRLVINHDCSGDYLYYQTPNPWLQVKSNLYLNRFNNNQAFTKIWDFSIRRKSIINQQKQIIILSNSNVLVVTSVVTTLSDFFNKAVYSLLKIINYHLLPQIIKAKYKYLNQFYQIQVKLLKILQLFPVPTDKQCYDNLMDILMKIIKKTQVTSTVNKNNADHGILFEAAKLIIHYQKTCNPELSNEVVQLLAIFISVREPNIRYLALETMCKFHQTPLAEQILSEHLNVILNLLRDQDISIKRRALDILYLMCGPKLVAKVVNSMLDFAEEAEPLFKEELVLKIAILAEKFADNLQWYIDVVIKLVSSSGEFVTDDIWYRITQILTGFGQEPDPEIRRYAAHQLYLQLNVPHVHSSLVKIGAYIIAEYAQSLVQTGYDPQKLFDVLNRHFGSIDEAGKAMLLTSFMKLSTQFEDQLGDQVQFLLQYQIEHFDPEIQQRAIEYLQVQGEDQNVRQEIFKRMPCFSIEQQNNNGLVKRIFALKTGDKKNDKKDVVDQDVSKFMNKSQTLPQNNGNNQILVNLQQNLLYELCKNKIAQVNLIEIGQNPLSQISNISHFKSLLTGNQGVIFEDQNISINYKQEFQAQMGRIAMQVTSQSGNSLEDVSFMISDDEGMIWKIAPVAYVDGSVQIQVQVMSINPQQKIPVAYLSYEMYGQSYKVEFSMPVLQHKFVQAIDMPIQNALNFYEEYTRSDNMKHMRIDKFIKNPAPSNIPLIDVMRKVGALFSNGINLKANAQPSMNDIKEITATGQFHYKQDNNIQTIPIILQIECFEEDKSYLRFSLRTMNQNLIQNLYHIVMFYLS